MLKKLAQNLGIDFDIGNTILLRLWSTISGGALVLMIPLFLSSAEQGYYFTFSSFIGMQIFFELGFNFVIMQMISHEMINVELKQGTLHGNENSIARIYGLISLLIKWYSVIAILFFAVVFSFGFHFFSINGSLSFSQWGYAWFFIVLFSALNVFVSPFFSVLEGLGLVGRVAQIRLIQSIVGFILLTVFFALGLQLNALSAITGAAAFFSIFCLLTCYYNVLFAPLTRKFILDKKKISWRREIFPFQWRIAISWLSGYFIFQLFSPLIFTHQGEVAAGQVGLSLTIFSTILSLSISWVNAKIPHLSKFISGAETDKINPFFMRLFLKSVLANLFFSVSFVAVVVILYQLDFSLVSRLVSLNNLLILVAVNAVNHIVFCLASYMRAHKKEPMLFNSVATGLLVGVTIFFMSKIDVYHTFLAYFIIMTFICLPWTVLLFLSYYKKNSSIKNKY